MHAKPVQDQAPIEPATPPREASDDLDSAFRKLAGTVRATVAKARDSRPE